MQVCGLASIAAELKHDVSAMSRPAFSNSAFGNGSLDTRVNTSLAHLEQSIVVCPCDAYGAVCVDRWPLRTPALDSLHRALHSNVTSYFRDSFFTFFTNTCMQEGKTGVAIYAMSQEHCKLCFPHVFSLLVIVVLSIAAMVIMYHYGYGNVL